jgi:hypothetical protein
LKFSSRRIPAMGGTGYLRVGRSAVRKQGV